MIVRNVDPLVDLPGAGQGRLDAELIPFTDRLLGDRKRGQDEYVSFCLPDDVLGPYKLLRCFSKTTIVRDYTIRKIVTEFRDMDIVKTIRPDIIDCGYGIRYYTRGKV